MKQYKGYILKAQLNLFSPQINNTRNIGNGVSFGSAIKITSMPLDYFDLRILPNYVSNLKKALQERKSLACSILDCLKYAMADLKYQLIIKQSGFEDVVPKLNITKTTTGPFAYFDPTNSNIYLNGGILNRKYTAQNKKLVENVLKHELSHAKQFIDVARCEDIGLDGLKSALREYLKLYVVVLEKDSEKLGQYLMQQLSYGKRSRKELLPIYNQYISMYEELKEKQEMLSGARDIINEEFYKKAVERFGIIKSGTPEAKKAKIYLESILDKVLSGKEKIETLKLRLDNGEISKEIYEIERKKIYLDNPLEVDAFPLD